MTNHRPHLRVIAWPGALLAASIGIAAPDPATAPAATQTSLQLLPDHATASVADLDKEVAWYEKVLGFHEIGRGGKDDFQVSHLLLGDYRIDLAWQKGSRREPTAGYQRQGWMHVVFRSPAIDAVYQHLATLGTDARKDTNDKGETWRIYLHDPEGNELEIVSSAFAEAINHGQP